LVRAAFFAAVERLVAVRFDALFLACTDSARSDAADLPSRLSALLLARERAAEVSFTTEVFFGAAFRAAGRFAGAFVVADFLADALVSCAAFFFVALLAVLAGFALIPARRALDSPIAMACFADRAPCLPSRMCSISS
jgi:hypothetical protein